MASTVQFGQKCRDDFVYTHTHIDHLARGDTEKRKTSHEESMRLGVWLVVAAIHHDQEFHQAIEASVRILIVEGTFQPLSEGLKQPAAEDLMIGHLTI